MITNDKAQEIAQTYIEALVGMGVDGGFPSGDDPSYMDHEKSLDFAFSLCEKILRLTSSNADPEKVQRTLGFVQGLLWSANIFTLNELRQHLKYPSTILD